MKRRCTGGEKVLFIIQEAEVILIHCLFQCWDTFNLGDLILRIEALQEKFKISTERCQFYLVTKISLVIPRDMIVIRRD